jgi:hypothetical protein
MFCKLFFYRLKPALDTDLKEKGKPKTASLFNNKMYFFTYRN